LPLRITYFENYVKTGFDMACTYDIYDRGARVIGLREATVGQVVMVERGRNKAMFRISWIGNPQSELRGQFGIECIDEGKVPWKQELEEFQEVYSLFDPASTGLQSLSEKNRRRVSRYPVEGVADLLKRRHCAPIEAQLHDISEHGCRLVVPAAMQTGVEVELNFSVSGCEITLQGQTRHAGNGHSGIQFHSIRRGDRPVLDYLLRTLSKPDEEATRWNFEVVRA
jgi:hypothetical protein